MDEPVDEIYEKVMNSGLYEQGFKQGELNMAIKLKQALDIGESCRISGFSKEELENEELNE